jgi:hypothetical protein
VTSIEAFAERIGQALEAEILEAQRRNGTSAIDWEDYRRGQGRVLGLRRAADVVGELLTTYRKDDD